MATPEMRPGVQPVGGGVPDRGRDGTVAGPDGAGPADPGGATPHPYPPAAALPAEDAAPSAAPAAPLLPPARHAVGSGRAGSRRGTARLVGAGTFAAALGVLLIRLGRPAYWLDEATTTMLVSRGWRDLARVVWRIDTPMALYYLLMKPWLAISTAEWWVRLPSAVPMAVAAGLVAAWAARRWSVLTGVLTGAVMVVLPSFTRFGQEVRPYGLMVLSAVLCSLAWWRWRERGGRAAAAGYAISVGILPLLHLLALTVVAAHLVTGAVAGGARRWGVVARTAGLAVLGLLPVLPYMVVAQLHALGVAHPVPLTAANWWATFIGAFGDQTTTPLSHRVSTVVLLLAVVGLVGLRDAGRRPALVLALTWAVLPPVILGAAAVVKSTLVSRYFLVALPGWVVLAGNGAAVLAATVTGLAARSGRTTAPGAEPAAEIRDRLRADGRADEGPHVPQRPAGAGRLVAAVAVGLAPVVLLTWMSLPSQRLYRQAAGHGQGDPRGAVALVNSPALRTAPVIVMPTLQSINVLGYDPTLARRMVLRTPPEAKGQIVLANVSSAVSRHRLANQRRVIVIVYSAGCSTVNRGLLSEFRVTEVATYPKWCVAVLDR